MKYWHIIISVACLVGAAYVTHDDVREAKGDIVKIKEEITGHEGRIIRIEEAVKEISAMRQDIKETNATLLKILRHEIQ